MAKIQRGVLRILSHIEQKSALEAFLGQLRLIILNGQTDPEFQLATRVRICKNTGCQSAGMREPPTIALEGLVAGSPKEWKRPTASDYDRRPVHCEDRVLESG